MSTRVTSTSTTLWQSTVSLTRRSSNHSSVLCIQFLAFYIIHNVSFITCVMIISNSIFYVYLALPKSILTIKAKYWDCCMRGFK